MTLKFKLNLVATATMAISLAACGGGGSGAAPAATGSNAVAPIVTAPITPVAPIVIPPVTPAPVTPVTPVGPTALSQELLRTQATDRINQIRQQCGVVNLLPSNAQAQTASSNHLNYMVLNKKFTQAEDPNLPGFTGATAYQQLNQAGYNKAAGGVFSVLPVGVSGAQWIDSVLSTVAGPRLLFLSQELSMSFLPYPDAANPSMMVGHGFAGALPINFKALSSTANYATYPCNGMTGVLPQNAVANFPGSTSPFFTDVPVTSTPITLVGGATDSFTINSATVTDPDGRQVPLEFLDSVTPGTQFLTFVGTGTAIILPKETLRPDTQYKVEVDFKQVLTAVRITYLHSHASFSFTTGKPLVVSPNRPF